MMVGLQSIVNILEADSRAYLVAGKSQAWDFWQSPASQPASRILNQGLHSVALLDVIRDGCETGALVRRLVYTLV